MSSRITVTDWRDLRAGDEVQCLETFDGLFEGEAGVVVAIEDPGITGEAVQCRFSNGVYWIKRWRFIRRLQNNKAP